MQFRKKLLLVFSLLMMVAGLISNPSLEAVYANTEDSQATSEYGVTIHEDTINFVDGRGQEVTLDKHPERAIVLYNSLLEIWMANGGSIVGKLEPTAGRTEIPGTEDAEIIGKLGAISVEKIISLDPDLIVINATQKSQMELIPAFEANNIPVLAIEYVGFEDYMEITRIFTALHERDDLFQANGLDLKTEIEDLLAQVPEDRDHTVLLIMASAKSVTARDSSAYVGMMLDDLNMINIADDSGGALSSKNFSMEKILEEDPDFIFVQTTGSDLDAVMGRLKEDTEANPAWASLSAVQNDRYIILPKDMYMLKANLRYPEAYDNLAQIIYPDIFQ